jgi:hypothetical protein
VIIACYNCHYSPSGTVNRTAAPRRAPTWHLRPVIVAVVEHYRRAHDLCSSGINRGAGVTYSFLPPLPLLPRALLLERSSAVQTTETLRRRRRSASRRRQCSLLLGLFFYAVAGLLPLQHIARGDRIFSASSPSLHRRHANSGEFFLLFFAHVSLHPLSGNLSGLDLL